VPLASVVATGCEHILKVSTSSKSYEDKRNLVNVCVTSYVMVIVAVKDD
jgi:hypothetical protein